MALIMKLIKNEKIVFSLFALCSNTHEKYLTIVIPLRCYESDVIAGRKFFLFSNKMAL